MKQKLQAGMELDLLTKNEVTDILQSWRNELSRGARVRRYAVQGFADGAGNLLMGANTDGPDQGMVWGITRLSVAPGPTLAAAGLSVYANDASTPSALLVGRLLTDLYPDARGCMIQGGDSLRIAGAGITASAQVTVTMSIREVPVQMAWSL